MMNRINFWSSPRNISTALMYSFAQRDDITVVDEPLYAHYLKHTDSPTVHPGTQEVLDTMEQDGQEVVKKIILGDYPTPIVLFKQMTHHLIHLNLDFLKETNNVLLIRDPRYIIASYSKVAPPNMTDIGIAKQVELFHHLKSIDRLNAVVDASRLLLNPGSVLNKLCEKLQISFDEKMLSWPPGERPEDGCWAKYWYHNVHNSSGFQLYKPKIVQLPAALEQLAEDCQPHYDLLLSEAIHP